MIADRLTFGLVLELVYAGWDRRLLMVVWLSGGAVFDRVRRVVIGRWSDGRVCVVRGPKLGFAHE